MFRRLLQGSLQSRFTRLIVIPSAAFLLIILSLVTARIFRNAVDQAETSALNLVRIHAARLDRTLAEAARVPEMHARVLESGVLKDPEELQRYLTDVLKRTQGIYGTCLAFQPGTFIPHKRNYAPYAYWASGKPEFRVLEPPEYDHFLWDWYQQPKRLGHPLWTEPFFDEGGGNVIMTTRSMPFFRLNPDGSRGEFWGVATIDISLEQLVSGLSTVKAAETGYALLLSPEGRIIACPDASKVMKVRLENVNPRLAHAMMPGSEGFIKTFDPLGQRDAWVAFTPVPGANFMLALVYPADEVFRNAYRLLGEMLLIVALAVTCLFLSLWFVARSVSGPVIKLAAAARRIAGGDLEHRFNEPVHIDEVRDLSAAFGKMTRDLKMRMEELRYSSTLRERMEGELNAARRIQMSMLPKQWSDRADWPEHASIALHAIIQPAREVGGDFYDYRFLDPERLSILIGDVSGKGVPAALFMAMTQTLFQAHASPERSVSAIMARVNDALCDESHTGMFVTLLYAVLNVRTGTLEICNAGHPPPYRLSDSGELDTIKSDRNPALGLVRGFGFSTGTFILTKGDRLFFYTDGVTEAFNSAQQLYTHQRLENLLAANTEKTVDQLTQAVINDVQHHSQSHEASDDLTVLAVKYVGREG
ncbi:MAG: SpoIIE family protein phosphatase [Verrucomicrobium sp.]